jgi:hypothetical protein
MTHRKLLAIFIHWTLNILLFGRKRCKGVQRRIKRESKAVLRERMDCARSAAKTLKLSIIYPYFGAGRAAGIPTRAGILFCGAEDDLAVFQQGGG